MSSSASQVVLSYHSWHPSSLRRSIPDKLIIFAEISFIVIMIIKRWHSINLKKPIKLGLKEVSRQPTSPVRTRFAPSPTGFLHLGSLRTALYNFLLARATKGDFILRLEDTDQNRLVKGAEENIYETLKWLNVTVDEGPVEGGPFSPYKQSERDYSNHVHQMIETGSAYRCFCNRERLEGLRESAKLLKPPTNVTYDRHCLKYSKAESDKLSMTKPYTIRFRSPDKYPPFEDLLHGSINLQPQINQEDVRYDDPILVKSDGLPTYHFANVIDDHYMNITHVIRGEEWLPSTPKHIALYNSFNWKPPKFVHIPLLTSIEDKKLSKRSGDIDIMSLKAKGYLPEALINFAVLFGWAPKRSVAGQKQSEVMSLSKLEEVFSLDDLTKGNAKVDFKKLDFLNKHYLNEFLKDKKFFNESVDEVIRLLETKGISTTRSYVEKVLQTVGSLTTLNELSEEQVYLFSKPVLAEFPHENTLSILIAFREALKCHDVTDAINLTASKYPKKQVFEAVRFAISGGVSGVKLPVLAELLGSENFNSRINDAINLAHR